jgi:serine O-acetyltransferase
MIFQRFLEEAKCYTDGAPVNLFNSLYLLFLNVGFQLNLLYRVSHRLHLRIGKKRFLWLIPRLLMLFERVWTGSYIDPGARIGKRLKIHYGMNIVIGEYVVIGDDAVIFNGISLGSVIPGMVEVKQPQIGNHVLIGSGAKVLGGIYVGDNVRIGANSVVLVSCESNVTLAGVPAKVFRSNLGTET